MARTTDINPDADIYVAAVIGNVVRIYAPCNKRGIRKQISTGWCRNHGQARLYAAEFDEQQRELRAKKGLGKVYD